MNAGGPYPRHPSGYALLEVLVSLFIFSVGILGIAAMQAVSIKNDSGLKYRADASILIDQLIGQMWADNRNPENMVALQNAYQGSGGSGGAKYAAWLADIQAQLPGAAAHPPTVTVAVVNGVFAASTKAQVTVYLFWQAPGDIDWNGQAIVHNVTAVSDIK